MILLAVLLDKGEKSMELSVGLGKVYCLGQV